MDQHQIPSSPFPTIHPTPFRLPFHLPDTIRHPPPAPLHALLDLILCQLDFLRVYNLGTVISLLRCSKVRDGPKEDAAVSVLDGGVIDDVAVGRVDRVCVSAVRCLSAASVVLEGVKECPWNSWRKTGKGSEAYWGRARCRRLRPRGMAPQFPFRLAGSPISTQAGAFQLTIRDSEGASSKLELGDDGNCKKQEVKTTSYRAIEGIFVQLRP